MHQYTQLPQMTRPDVQDANRVCMLVPGMHRSGTSALARVLSVMGATLPRTLMPANPTNPAGHWESDVIRGFNDELLRIAGRNWNDWTPIEPNFFASLSARAKLVEGRRIVADEYGDSGLFVLKDPRIAILAPFWLELLSDMGIAVVVICPVRHPLEVARSLAVREGFAIGEAQLIWLRHVLAAEAATRGKPRLYTSYEQLLSDWQEIVARIQRELGVAWPRSISSRQGEISQFLEPTLRHQEVDRIDSNADPYRSGWMWQVFQVLSRWVQQGEDANDYPLLDEIISTFDTAAPVFEPVIAAGSNALARIRQLEVTASDPLHGAPLTLETEANGTSAERDRMLAEIADQLAVAQGEAAEASARGEAVRVELSTQLADAQQSAAEAHASAQAEGAARAELRRSLDDAVAAQSDSLKERETLAERLRHRESQLEQRGEELAQLWAELSDNRSKLAEEAGRADSLATENARRHAQHAELERWVFLAAGERLVEQRALAKLRDALVPLRHQRDTLKAAVAARDQTLGELRGEVKRLTQAHSAAERLAADADRRAGDAQNSRDHHAIRLDEARHELASLARLLAAAQDALSVARLQADLAMREPKLGEVEAARGQAEDAHDQAIRESEDRQAAALQAEDRLREANAARVAAEERLRDTEARHAEAAASHRRTAQEHGDLAGKLIAARRAFDTLETRAVEDRRRMQNEAEIAAQNADWLRQVMLSLSHGRWWWSLLPKHRDHKLARRLKNKGLFDSDAYLALYPDVVSCGHTPIEHYLRHGLLENRECPR